MKVNLKALGCRLNEAENESWANQFHNAGHQIVRSPQQADLIVLNTCAVTNQAGRKSRQMIHRLHRGNPNAKLVVSGCYATLETDKTAAELGVDLVIPNQQKKQLVDRVEKDLIPDTMTAAAAKPGQVSLFQQGRQRAFIKVQDGCRYRCTFCIVTVARGEEKSYSIDDIVRKINYHHNQGVHEIILTGVHLGGYGADIGTRLDTLVQNILDRTDIPRIRFGSLEPWDLPDSFLKLFHNPRLMPHLHLPLQSGSDSVLRRMARRCKIAEFRRLVDQARSEIDEFNLTTDIIVGFPGETHQEWEDSLRNIEKIGFGQIHIFSYSAREGTKAAGFANHVPKLEKKKRSRALHQLAESMKQDTFGRNIGRKFPVLWESSPENADLENSTMSGYTPNYIRVTSPAIPELENTIRLTQLTGIQDSGTAMEGYLDLGIDILN